MCLANAHKLFGTAGTDIGLSVYTTSAKAVSLLVNNTAAVPKSALSNERDTLPQALEQFRQPQTSKRRAQQTGAIPVVCE